MIQRPTPDNAPVGTYAMWDERMSVTRIRVEEGKPQEYTFEGISAALSVSGEITIHAADGTAPKSSCWAPPSRYCTWVSPPRQP